METKLKNTASSIYTKLTRDVSNMSDYAKCVFHPTTFATFLPHLYHKINSSFQSYSLKFDEIDWDDIYPFLLTYAQTADPIGQREQYITNMEQAHQDLLHHLGDYFVHLTMATQQKYNNVLREQAGTWAYKASHALAPKYPLERPFNESTLGDKLLHQEEQDSAIESYFVTKTPYMNALDRAAETEKFTNTFFEQGGW